MKDRILRLFRKPLVRHVASTVLSVVVAVGLTKANIDPNTAGQVGRAVSHAIIMQ